MGTGGSTIKRGGSLNNYMYYNDNEDGEFFAEDLDFRDEKKKDGQAEPKARSSIISRSTSSPFKKT